MTTDNIITKVSRKNATGFDAPYFLGSSARFVSGIRGVTGNNIEENILLGCDSITTETTLENGVKHIVREYRSENQTTEFYFVDLYIYHAISSGERWFYGDGLYLPENRSDNIFDSEGLFGVNLSVYSIDDSHELLEILNNEEEPLISKATLKFTNATGTVIPVAEKTIYAKKNVSGQIVQRQVVTNLL